MNNVDNDTLNNLITKYESIVYDYLAVMNSSETVKSMDVAKYTVQIGLNAITHIYKLAFCMTKCVATAAEHCQKGIYCFIEYIEQTYKLGYMNHSSQQFDFMDAVTFIYDKTLSELGSDEQPCSSAFVNILSASTQPAIDCRNALEQFGRVTSVLVWTNHTTMTLTDQMEIVDAHLIDFLLWSSSSHKPNDLNSDLFMFIETAQDTIVKMDKKEYMDFLTAIKKQIKKQEKKGIDTIAVLPACLYLKTLSGMVLTEIAEQERWKRGADDLAKFVFVSSNSA